jgi:hypothetical protein
MNTGIYFPLDRFEHHVLQDPTVLGVWYTGSLGRGTGDRFSDLDIYVWLDDGAYPGAASHRAILLATLGEIQFMYPSADAPNATALVGPDWQRVDLDLVRREDLVPKFAFSAARVVKDTDNVIADLVAASPAVPDPLGIAGISAQIEEIIDSHIYLALHNARGAHWSAMGEISSQAGQTYTLLAALRGRQSFGFRYVESVLDSDERALLEAVWPSQPQPAEIRRAARALWTWTRFVWTEAERTLGQLLPIVLDEQQFLHAIERIYEWE